MEFSRQDVAMLLEALGDYTSKMGNLAMGLATSDPVRPRYLEQQRRALEMMKALDDPE